MRLRASPGREEDLGVDMTLMLPHQRRPTISSGCVGNARMLDCTCNHDRRWSASSQRRTESTLEAPAWTNTSRIADRYCAYPSLGRDSGLSGVCCHDGDILYAGGAGDAAPFAPSGMPWTERGACDMRSHPAVTMPFSCCPLNYSPKTRKWDGSCWVAWSQKGNGAALGR